MSIRDAGSSGGVGRSTIISTSAAFGGKAVTKSDNIHLPVILGIRVIPSAFTTCANDGRIGVWPFKALNENFKGRGISKRRLARLMGVLDGVEKEIRIGIGETNWPKAPREGLARDDAMGLMRCRYGMRL
jgi:hypothetical protein